MAHYINKDALVAEIEKVIDEPAPSHDQQCPWEDGYYCGLNKAESIIENLEVKEIDLETQIEDYINSHFTEGCDGVMISDWYKVLGGVHYKDLVEIAKHFFELGIKVAQKGE